MNQLEAIRLLGPEGIESDCAKFTISLENSIFAFRDIVQLEQSYVFGSWVKSDAAGFLVIGEDTIATSSDWARVVHRFDASTNDFIIEFVNPGVYYFCNSKLEKGNVPTDWTPAIEDTQQDISDAQNLADSAHSSVENLEGRVNIAQLTIDAINAQIQSLVVGEDGQSMMEQTDTGFQFNFSTFQEQIQNALDGVTEVQGELDDVDSAVGSIQSSVSYLNELNSYITMSSEEGTPYIELGQQDGEFKVRITNTEMAFMQGTQKIAYLTNHQLYIQSSVVTDELQIGEGTGYIWRKRSNNHLGLRYVTA